ncbi:MAG: 6-phosphogluconolactonase [Pseudomonadota bacterium]
MRNPAVFIYADLDELSAQAAARWVALAGQAIAARGWFHVALSGGSTPRHLYERLARAEFAARVDWRRVHIYFGDERCVAPDHPDSNFRMAREALLQHVPIPAAQVHRIETEQGDPRAAAYAYEQTLLRHMPAPHGRVQCDLMLLGLGPDGHTASLFPDTPILNERERLVAAVYVEKLQAWRISMTFPMIDHSRHILVMVAGRDKADVVRQALRGDTRAPRLPVQMIEAEGDVEWYMDRAAAQQLDDGQST